MFSADQIIHICITAASDRRKVRKAFRFISFNQIYEFIRHIQFGNNFVDCGWFKPISLTFYHLQAWLNDGQVQYGVQFCPYSGTFTWAYLRSYFSTLGPCNPLTQRTERKRDSCCFYCCCFHCCCLAVSELIFYINNKNKTKVFFAIWALSYFFKTFREIKKKMRCCQATAFFFFLWMHITIDTLFLILTYLLVSGTYYYLDKPPPFTIPTSINLNLSLDQVIDPKTIANIKTTTLNGYNNVVDVSSDYLLYLKVLAQNSTAEVQKLWAENIKF